MAICLVRMRGACAGRKLRSQIAMLATRLGLNLSWVCLAKERKPKRIGTLSTPSPVNQAYGLDLTRRHTQAAITDYTAYAVRFCMSHPS
jgi:hypothetical protein